MTAWFEYSKNSDGLYHFVLKAPNGEVILRSQLYHSKEAVEIGMASIRTNATHEERFERKEASDGRFYFNLKAVNHHVIGTSQMYKSAESRDHGIESVKANGTTIVVKEVPHAEKELHHPKAA